MTLVEPFKLASLKKMGNQVTAKSPFKPFAVQIQEFDKALSDRHIDCPAGRVSREHEECLLTRCIFYFSIVWILFFLSLYPLL